MYSKPTIETYNEFQTAFDYLNKELFNNQLPDCIITYQRKKYVAGYYSSGKFENDIQQTTDEIALNPTYFRGEINGEKIKAENVLQTLAHEMCHMWQKHFGKPGRGRYHNKEWANKMIEIGLIPSDTGAEGGKQTGDSMSDYIDENGNYINIVTNLIKKHKQVTWSDRQANTCAPGEIDDEEETKKKKVKVKYTCPECGLNAWGKPDIHVICGEDMNRMTEPG